jgi:exodeoxyribonuclease VII large subunit
MRAPTPTAAAEMAVPVRHELMAWVQQAGGRMAASLSGGLWRRGQRLRDLGRALPRPDALVAGPRQRIDTLGDRLGPALIAGVQRRRVRLSDAAGSLRPAMLSRQIRAERHRLVALDARLAPALARIAAQNRERLEARTARLVPRLLVQDVDRARGRLDAVLARLRSVGTRQIERLGQRLEAMDRLRETLGYRATLARGYAVVRGGGGEIVTTRQAAEAASGLEIEFGDGRLKLGGGGPVRKGRGKPPEQGSLF